MVNVGFSAVQNDATYASNERRDQGDTSLGTGNSLAETKQKRKVTVDAVITLKLPCCLDTFPCGGDLDEDTILGNANRLVESNELLGLRLCTLLVE